MISATPILDYLRSIPAQFTIAFRWNKTATLTVAVISFLAGALLF